MEIASLPVPLVNGVRIAGAIVIAIALPLFLLSNAVRSVTLDEGLYLSQFAKYRVGLVTGLSDSELQRVAQAFITYFQSGPGDLNLEVTTTREGQVMLFNEREVAHMRDVQVLMRRVLSLQTIAFVALLVAVIVIVATGPRTAASLILRATAIGGGTTVLIIGALSLAAAADFDRLFMQFHFMSFSNDLWLLDPRKDRLIQLFPEGYFYDAALRIGIQTVGFGLASLVASLGLLYALKEPS